MDGSAERTVETHLPQALAALRDRRAPVDVLRALGAAEPEKDAHALLPAVAHPELSACVETWLPGVLASARPGFAALTLADVAERGRDAGWAVEADTLPALVAVLGASDFLARLLLRHPDWIGDLRPVHGGSWPAAPAPVGVAADWTAIRVAKYRGLLRIAARDLLGRPFEQSLKELSDLADRLLSIALELAHGDRPGEAPSLLALGKLGSHELNFSSDVDLLFLYHAEDASLVDERHGAAEDTVRSLKRNLEASSEDGFGYRVDLDLRPLGRLGPLVNPVDAALEYYEARGAEWERQMLIRLRPVAGAAGLSFQDQIAPFTFRRLIDPLAIRRVREMKIRIETERRQAGRDLEADLKEGPGGIRDVEFLAQALQLFHGGQHPELRTGDTRSVLATLADLGLLPAEVAEGLRASYLWLRRIEHSVQLVEERQTHRVPADAQARTALARRAGYREASGRAAHDAFLEDWTRVRTAVRQHFDALVLETEDE